MVRRAAHGCKCNKFFNELLANSGSLMSRGLENAGCMKAIVVKIAR